MLPPSVAAAARRHKAPTPEGADLKSARTLPPRGFPEADRFSPLALRHASAILDRSRPFMPLAPSLRPKRQRQGSPRAPLQARAKA